MIAPPIVYPLLADLIVLVHVAFVMFAVFGGLLAVKWRSIVWIHGSAAVWAALVECAGWLCPLTPLENWLRDKAGGGGYRSDFIAHYIFPVLYPEGLTRGAQLTLGALVILVNCAIYGWAFRTRKAAAKKLGAEKFTG